MQKPMRTVSYHLSLMDISSVQVRWAPLRYGAQCWRRAGAAIMGNDAITIGRVHGHASGGGCGMMMVNDLVVCEESTRIWLPEVELGTPMIGGLTPVLAHIIVRPQLLPFLPAAISAPGLPSALGLT